MLKEYRVRPVSRWIVTEADVDPHGQCASAGRVIGTYDTEQTASLVVSALEEAAFAHNEQVKAEAFSVEPQRGMAHSSYLAAEPEAT